MRKGRISSAQHTTRKSAGVNEKKVRFLGISLSGGKADKACLAVVDYFPNHNKLFLTRIFERIKNEDLLSADARLIDLVYQHSQDVAFLGFDVPWRVPLCIRHTYDCPGTEACDKCHAGWQRDFLTKLGRKRKGKKVVTPYTQRSVELYLAHGLEEPFEIGHAMGANTAPLLARANFLQRRLSIPVIEVSPRVALWRIGRSLNVSKSHLRFHRHSVGGDESRRIILEQLGAKARIFIYEQDRKMMIENNHAFEAFLVALTGYLKFSQQTDSRPKDFPEAEDWVEIPSRELDWEGLR